MTYTPNVSPTTYNPTGHATLSDGTTTMQFLLCKNNGDEDELAITRNNASQSPFISVFSNQKYDDENLPYGTMVQQDWSGGRGLEDYEDDTTRYYDAGGVDSINGDTGLILNGLPTYATGFHTVQEDWYGNVTWRGLYSTTRYVSEKFTTTSAWNTDTITLSAWVKIRKVGSPTSSLYFKIYSNSSNKPSAVLVASAAIPYTTFTDTLGVIIQFTLATGTDLADATAYHVVVHPSADGTAASHWEVACDSTSTTSCVSADGSTWTITTGYAPYYRFWNTADKKFTANFFEYKGALYCATRPDDGTAGKLYINGWRGACDSNSGDLTYLNDATAPGWTADELIGNIAKITEGDAARVENRWRTITGNTTTAVEVSPDWDVAQTTSDSYVILGNKKWTEISNTYLGSDILTRPVAEVAVANGIVYLLNQGDSTRTTESIGSAKFHGYNNGASGWTNEWGPTGFEAQHIAVVHDETLGPVLWFGRVNYDDEFFSDLYRIVAPLKWSTNQLISGTTLHKCMSAWDESDPVSGVTPSYTYGSVSTFTITDTFATGILGSDDIPSTDIRPFNKVHFRIKSTVDLSAGVLQICFDNTAKCASPPSGLAVDLPALRANVWTTCDLDITTNVSGAEAIISIGFNCTADQDKAMVISVLGPVRVFSEYSPILINNRINSLEAYGSPQTLWVLGEDEVGYVDGGYYVPSEIKGLKPLASEDNGRAHVADDVYLYFNIGNNMHRYYSQSLNNIGIYKEAGMPSDRIAKPVCAKAYEDKVYVAYDGGSDDYSYIMCYHGGGWHEVFRAPMVNKRIRSIYIQPIPGSNTDRLWISMDTDVLYIPICSNPYPDPDYEYIDEGYIESSWIYGSRRDIKKFYKSIKLFCENVSASAYYIQADYKLDNDSAWTAISNDFDTIQEEVDISSATPPTSTGKRFKYRLRFYTNDKTKTPRLKQVAIRGVGYAKQKYQYSFYWMIAEGDENEDLEGNVDNTFTDVNDALSQMDTWAEEITPLTFNSIYTPYHNKTVFIIPGSNKPYYIDVEEKSGQGREKYFGFVTLLEA